jgi:hypothetical protein
MLNGWVSNRPRDPASATGAEPEEFDVAHPGVSPSAFGGGGHPLDRRHGPIRHPIRTALSGISTMPCLRKAKRKQPSHRCRSASGKSKAWQSRSMKSFTVAIT